MMICHLGCEVHSVNKQMDSLADGWTKIKHMWLRQIVA